MGGEASSLLLHLVPIASPVGFYCNNATKALKHGMMMSEEFLLGLTMKLLKYMDTQQGEWPESSVQKSLTALKH